MAISRALRRRIETDAKAPDHWYVPKGQSIQPSNWERIAGHLSVLEKFQKVPWNEAQPQFAKELLLRELIEPYKDHHDGFSAVARMQFPIWRLLGLAWINSNNVPEITEVGRLFVASKSEDERRKLLATQLHRYQFYNPSTAPHFTAFRSFPVLALYRLLVHCDWRISWDEMRLFGTRVRNFPDADTIADLVEEWRTLMQEERETLITLAQTLTADSHTKSEEGTTLGKVDRDLSYLRALLQVPGTLQETKEGLVVPTAMRRRVRTLGLRYEREAEFIDYESEQDWLAYYGQAPERARWDAPWSTVSDARQYYERIGKVDAAIGAFEREDGGKSKRAVKEYRSIQILEKVLEDILEHNLDALEEGLELVGRQYPTAVGPIDLLAKDVTGVYVVIELKRGASSDRIVGQIARYIAWVTDRLTAGKKAAVRGIVVGKSFDRRFGAAVSMLSRVDPYVFDLKVMFDRWNQKDPGKSVGRGKTSGKARYKVRNTT